MTRKVKKLYFSVTLTRGSDVEILDLVGTGAVFPCTNFRSALAPAGLYSGDNNRCVLEDFAPIAATDPPSARSARDVSAWFQLNSRDFNAGASISRGPVAFLIDFVNATTVINPLISPLPLPAFGSIPAGQSTLGTQHFAVRVRPMSFTSSGTYTVNGTLYVQRQHSIEV